MNYSPRTDDVLVADDNAAAINDLFAGLSDRIDKKQKQIDEEVMAASLVEACREFKIPPGTPQEYIIKHIRPIYIARVNTDHPDKRIAAEQPLDPKFPEFIKHYTVITSQHSSAVIAIATELLTQKDIDDIREATLIRRAACNQVSQKAQLPIPSALATVARSSPMDNFANAERVLQKAQLPVPSALATVARSSPLDNFVNARNEAAQTPVSREDAAMLGSLARWLRQDAISNALATTIAPALKSRAVPRYPPIAYRQDATPAPNPWVYDTYPRWDERVPKPAPAFVVTELKSAVEPADNFLVRDAVPEPAPATIIAAAPTPLEKPKSDFLAHNATLEKITAGTTSPIGSQFRLAATALLAAADTIQSAFKSFISASNTFGKRLAPHRGKAATATMLVGIAALATFALHQPNNPSASPTQAAPAVAEQGMTDHSSGNFINSPSPEKPVIMQVRDGVSGVRIHRADGATIAIERPGKGVVTIVGSTNANGEAPATIRFHHHLAHGFVTMNPKYMEPAPQP